LTIEIQNVNINGGTIFGSIYYTETAYKNRTPDANFQIDPINQTIFKEILLPEGEYVISIYQDTNGNGKLDMGMFNIPKEPVGITNYTGGIPGNFNKLKINISNNIERITIRLLGL
jgi:uncharacterized protein (DUF2141 family)